MRPSNDTIPCKLSTLDNSSYAWNCPVKQPPLGELGHYPVQLRSLKATCG